MTPTPWSANELTRFVRDYEAGLSERELLERFPGKTVGQFRGKAINMQLHRPMQIGAYVLPADHPAVVAGRTMFTGRVRNPREAPALLLPGRDQRKLGGRIRKGSWKGFPIFSLTLEERATCPRSCHMWRGCMGNSMQWAARNAAGAGLERRLYAELAVLQRRNPAGFAVRLHILGDFYSTAYVDLWAEWLDEFPALHVWGYTAWDPENSEIGRAVSRLAAARWDRFAVRLSSTGPGPQRAVTVWDATAAGLPGVLVCPQEVGKTRGCGTCALCWSPAAREKTIGFLAHGRKPGRKPTRREAAP